jgi:hypothetical protein
MSAARSRQLDLFVALLAVGTLAHEATVLDVYHRLDQAPLTAYLDGYSLLVPTLPIPGRAAFLAHLTLLGLCVLLILHPRRRGLAHALLPLLALHFFLQGAKISNHLVVLLLATSAYGAYGVCEWVRRRALGDAGAPLAEANVRFLGRMVLLLVVSTYLFAALAKLNTDFLDPRTTPAQGFVERGFAPLLAVARRVGGATAAPALQAAGVFFGAVGIASTLAFEIGLPLALLVRRWRPWALVAGLLFHLAILYWSALDFSMVMLALYVLLPEPEELRDYVGRYVTRWHARTVGAALAISMYLSLGALVEALRQGGLSGFEGYRLTHIVAVSYLLCCGWRWARGREDLRERHPEGLRSDTSSVRAGWRAA